VSQRVGLDWSDLAPTLVALVVKNPHAKARDPGWIPGLGSSPREGIGYPLQYSWASLGAQMVKNPPTMPETWVRSLGWEDPLEEGMATHSSILAWRIPWAEETGGLQSMRSQRVGHDWVTKYTHAGLRLRPELGWGSQENCFNVESLMGHRENGFLHEISVWELELLLECSEVWKTL